MSHIEVQSSNIHSIDYDPQTETLEVIFKNGGVYQYHKVSHDEWVNLMNDSSKGKHLAEHIKSKHEHTKVVNL